MRLHLNLSLRRALLAAMATACTLASTVYAGVADTRYDLQYYLDFAQNKGIFAAGATNISVYFKDGSSVNNSVIPIMPSLDGYGRKIMPKNEVAGLPSAHGGCGLISPQFVAGAAHVGENTVYFLPANGQSNVRYTSTGYATYASDFDLQRLNKIVTEVTYDAPADNEFMSSLTKNDTWLYRLGDGMYYNVAGEPLAVNSNAIGGLININSIQYNAANGGWGIEVWFRSEDTANDTRPPLDHGQLFGDSGSPVYAWDSENNRLLYVGAASASNVHIGFNNYTIFRYNYDGLSSGMDSFTTQVSDFGGTNTIVWGAQDAETGKGTLTQGNLSVEYVGRGTGNTDHDTKGLTFSTADTGNMQVLELQSSVNMGAGAMTFDSGSWLITEKDAAHTFNSAGFVVNKGANLTLELTATSAEEWRKVGEGTMTISGEGKNEAVLRVGGGTTKYDVSYDEDGNIIGCSLGNIGETRLNRTGDYAASSVRLEAGSAIIVLMQDGQFKTNSVVGDTFTFGNAGGLLNLNGHDLTWGVINQDGSGIGARIGNKTPLGEAAPRLSTFTYTGTGTFAGCFVDEGKDSTAQLAVKYQNDGGTWTLTGNHSNVGGFVVEAGTMILQGTNTPHVNATDKGDWTYATLENSDVTVKSGAEFRLSHHAFMTGNVIVKDKGSFVLAQTVNESSESMHGSLRMDMESLGLTSLRGNVSLEGDAKMTADIDSAVTTTMSGNIIGNGTNDISFSKTGSGVFVVNGKVNVPFGQVSEGGLVIGDASDISNWMRWTIGEKGFLAAVGLDNAKTLSYISPNSFGVLALTSDQTTALNLTNHQNLIIGAWGEVDYGTSSATLGTVTDATYGEVWRLGGGTGTLNVHFLLTGDADLLIGNEWSSGTVHLANSANDFRGDIYIQGMGNKLTYAQGALGEARVAVTYGNALGLYESKQLDIVKDGSIGILALVTNENLDLQGTSLAVGADGDLTYTGTLTVDDTYRFGGSGNLTLDTALDAGKDIEIDAQGTEGSSVTFARESAHAGNIAVGGGLQLDDPNSFGSISVHVGHNKALAQAASVTLQKGGVLHTDGREIEVRNLSALSGSSIVNQSTGASRLSVNITDSAEFADGVLSDASNYGGLHLVKTGEGNLKLATNAGWSGGLTIEGGSVSASIAADGDFNSTGGIGSTANTIHIAENGTLLLKGANRQSYYMGGTRLVQNVSGTGTIEFSTGGAALFSDQTFSFEGTLKLTGNTRLYLGSALTTANYLDLIDTTKAVDSATIEVTSGSQARITSGLRYLKANKVTLNSDFVISGNGFAGADWGLLQSSLNGGALSIDGGSTLTGTITLKDDASIASWSAGPVLTSVSQWQSCLPGSNNASYALKGHLGGVVRGRILGEGKKLTLTGNETLTFTADSANTYGDLVISNGNGNDDDKVALKLDGGAARSQVSTALGKGEVTLGDNLILRLAGTGVADNTNVVYTYANDMTAGNGATIQSYNITNRLTGTVSMSGSTLNLATANGGVLELAGGIDGSGTLNVGAASVVSLGSAVAPLSAESPQFSGSIVAGAGADITLASPAVLASTTAITGTEALTLRFGGAGDYALGGISGASALTLHFDFTNTPTAGDAATWTTLNSSIAAGTTTIALDLNLFNELEQGNYTLISSAGTGTTYQLADTMNGRLNLVTNDAGALVLTVDADNRLYWRTGGSGIWNTTDANWYSDAAAGSTTFSSNANVMLDATGVAADNSSAARETISLSDSVAVGTLGVQESAYELTGAGAITGTSLTVGNGGDLKLSNAGGSTFTKGVVVNDAALTVEGNTVTADVRAEAGGQFSLQKGAGLSGNLTISDAEATISQSTLAGDVTARGNGKLVLESAAVSGARQLRFEEAGVLSASSGVTLSGTFTFAPRQTVLQAEGMSINTGSLSSTAALEVDTLAMSDASLTLTHAAGTTTQIDTITGNGSLNKESAGNLKLGDASLYGLTLKGGGVTTICGTVTVSNQLSVGKETLNLEQGAVVTVRQLTSGNTGNDSPSVININGGELHITGTTNVAMNNNACTSNSILLAHWKTSNSTLVLNGGKLVAEGAVLNTSRDSKGTFNAFGGEATLLGIDLMGHEDRARDGEFNLGKTDGGTVTVTLGSSGIKNISRGAVVNLGEGTLKASADFSISGSNAVNLVGVAKGTAFDTDGHKITVSTALTGDGNITKLGEGTLLISGSGSAYAGNIGVNAGALAVDATGKDILTSAASVAVGDGATLDLSALNFTDTSHRISVSTGTHISFADKSTVAFGGMVADTEYGVFDISGGVLEGWTDLSASNFTIDGVRLSDLGRVVLNLGMTGGFSYTIEDGWDLVWNGGESKQAWNQNEAKLVWQTPRPDDTTGELVETSVGYKNNDNVVFNSGADLELEGNIRVNNMTVADGVNLKTNGNLTITGALNVGSNVSWSFSGDTSLSFTETQLKDFAALEVGEGATLTMTEKVTGENNISTAFNKVSGAGNVVLNLAKDNGVGFNLSGIEGDITVAEGRLQVNTSTFNENSIIYLAQTSDSSNTNGELVFNGTGTVLKNDVVLETSTTFHVNDGKTGTISGVISGSGGLTKAGAGILTLAGESTLSGMTISGGTVKLADSMTLSGEGEGNRLNINAGTKLQLANGASVKRTTSVACWIQGSLEVLENASADFTSKDDVHLSYSNGDNKGSIVLQKNSELTMDVNKLFFYTGGSVSLGQGAELKLTKSSAHISNKGTTAATMTATNGQQYSMGNTNYELTNAHIKSVATSDAILSNKLTKSSVENAGSGKLTVSNADNKLTDIYATGGDLTVLQAATGLSLNELVVSGEQTVGLYTGDDVGSAEAAVVVSKLASFGAGATLNANLTLNDGSTLSLAEGGLAMGSTLTLNTGITLDEATLARIMSNESTTLFTGVDALNLGGESYDALTVEDKVLAAPYFKNLTSTNYVFTYTGTNNGTLSIQAIPEPTSSMLGLVGMVALTFRRRRK